jgi:hypothetical protein
VPAICRLKVAQQAGLTEVVCRIFIGARCCGSCEQTASYACSPAAARFFFACCNALLMLL